MVTIKRKACGSIIRKNGHVSRCCCGGLCPQCLDLPASIPIYLPEFLYLGPADLTYTEGWRTWTGSRTLTYTTDETLLGYFSAYVDLSTACVWAYQASDEIIILFRQEYVNPWSIYYGIRNATNDGWSTLIGSVAYQADCTPETLNPNTSIANYGTTFGAILGSSGVPNVGTKTSVSGTFSPAGMQVCIGDRPNAGYVQVIQSPFLDYDAIGVSDWLGTNLEFAFPPVLVYVETISAFDNTCPYAYIPCPVSTTSDWVGVGPMYSLSGFSDYNSQYYRAQTLQYSVPAMSAWPSLARQFNPVWVARWDCTQQAWDCNFFAPARPYFPQDWQTPRGWMPKTAEEFGVDDPGIMTCITDTYVMPALPTVTPTCYYTYETTYDCFSSSWADVTLVSVSTIAVALSDWTDTGFSWQKVTTSATVPAPPSGSGTCFYYWYCVFDCDTDTWGAVTLQYVDSFGTESAWTVYGTEAYCTTLTSATPDAPTEIPVC